MYNNNEIEFWYEFASGYSHISIHRIEELTEINHINIIWKPFLLGPIFKAQGWNTSPFNIYASKGKYMWKDLERQCYKYNVPYNRPSIFPRLSLLAARVALVANDQGWCAEFSKSVFKANYVYDLDISDTDTMIDIIEELGRDGNEIVEYSLSEENKRRLRDQVTEAISKDIFGAPSFISGRELFWGNDRLEEAIQHCIKTKK